MSNPSKAASYVQYPLDAKCYVPPGQDPALCHEMLMQNSPDLFQVTGGGMNMYLGGRDDSKLVSFVTSCSQLAIPFLIPDFTRCAVPVRSKRGFRKHILGWRVRSCLRKTGQGIVGYMHPT